MQQIVSRVGKRWGSPVGKRAGTSCFAKWATQFAGVRRMRRSRLVSPVALCPGLVVPAEHPQGAKGVPPARPALEEVVLSAETSIGNLRTTADGAFKFVQGLEHADGGVEGRPGRAVLGLAVPSGIG